MVNRFKAWWLQFKWPVQPNIPQLPNEEDLSKQLVRQILKIKDFSRINKLMSPDERKQYASEGSMIYQSQAFKDIISEIQYEQLVFMGLQSDNDRQLMIGRGTINGADLVEERIFKLHADHLQNLKDAQPIDDAHKHDVITSIE